ncbi:MAG: methylmalonyl-CoA epimerase [Bacteroidota bacterium]|jgi:methylmalonyl-CoA/ethylmalonyl-CoA epimerase|nr:methylmalonyl-CoA epimerase [Chitinophagaceae bacterium]MCE2758157.1 methylmalonyl-CoA epimerase [Chitinophagaceae bacterium]GDX43403.1 methylmalonyl-CoA epimerase [Bacteroidota bacterium]
MHKIDHIAIAVKSLALSIPLFEKMLGNSCYKIEEVASENVKTAFFQTGESKVELLEGMDPEGVITKFIEKKGEGLHHIAFGVQDLVVKIDELKKEGFEFISETPKKGADNKLIVFLHPKCTNGVLVELCQDIK